MKKSEVLKIIDDVMNNREIDSIRNAILAIRDKVLELGDEKDNGFDDWTKDYVARLRLRGNNPLRIVGDHFDGAKYVHIDTCMKNDTNDYGAIWYE